MRKLPLVLSLLISATSLTAMIRAGINAPPDGYYYDSYYYDGYYPYYGYYNYWYGPGWYWGVYFSNEGDYWAYRRGGWGYGPTHWRGRGYYYYKDGRRHGGGGGRHGGGKGGKGGH